MLLPEKNGKRHGHSWLIASQNNAPHHILGSRLWIKCLHVFPVTRFSNTSAYYKKQPRFGAMTVRGTHLQSRSYFTTQWLSFLDSAMLLFVHSAQWHKTDFSHALITYWGVLYRAPIVVCLVRHIGRHNRNTHDDPWQIPQEVMGHTLSQSVPYFWAPYVFSPESTGPIPIFHACTRTYCYPITWPSFCCFVCKHIFWLGDLGIQRKIFVLFLLLVPVAS